MRIINQKNSALLAENAEVASTFLQRAKGLLGRKVLPKGQALIIRHCDSVHTFFMRFSIDVLFVDASGRILKALPTLKPFRITKIYFNASYVIELPAGTIQSTATSQGDTLLLKKEG